MSRYSRDRRKGRASEMNLTPLIDVAFTLLIIFMITAPMLTTGVAIDLPKESTDPVATREEPLAVTIKSDGTIYIQDTEINLETLKIRLEAIVNKDKTLFVRGDKGADYGSIMEAVGVINQAGFKKIALITEPEQ